MSQEEDTTMMGRRRPGAMEEKLKPCPFCGHVFGFLGGCVHMLAMSSEMSACENWNVRPFEDSLRAQLAAARKEVKAFREIVTDLADLTNPNEPKSICYPLGGRSGWIARARETLAQFPEKEER